MVGVTLRETTKLYGETLAVDNASFTVEKGELFFLLGPSGCGKTTILRMIAGFLKPDEGAILFDERPIDAVPPHRRNTGMVFQSYALWPHMTVAANVAYGLRERKVPRAEREQLVEDALQTVRMGEYADRMPNQLSGGQQQRVALARALVIKPDVVLLDEPLSNLDAKLRLQMRAEIRRIHRETGITMIYVTHDQTEALSMAERLAVMSMGRIEQVGNPRAIYRRPANRFVAEFIGEANMLEGEVMRQDGDVAAVRTPAGELIGTVGPSTPPVGEHAVCMVRPECLNLGGREQNSLEATVREAVYLGSSEQLVCDADGTELLAVLSNPGDAPPGVGAKVRLGFAPTDAVILPKQ